MEGILYLILVTLLVAISSYFKLRTCKSVTEFHPFDVDATLALRGILAILIVCHHISKGFLSITPPVASFTHKLGKVIEKYILPTRLV
jgi:hypothetical protein